MSFDVKTDLSTAGFILALWGFAMALIGKIFGNKDIDRLKDQTMSNTSEIALIKQDNQNCAQDRKNHWEMIESIRDEIIDFLKRSKK